MIQRKMQDDMGVLSSIRIRTMDGRSRDTLLSVPTAAESNEAIERLMELIGFDGGTVYDALAGVPEQREKLILSMADRRAKDRQAATGDTGGNELRRMRDETGRTLAQMNKAAKAAWPE